MAATHKLFYIHMTDKSLLQLHFNIMPDKPKIKQVEYYNGNE